MPAGTLEVLAQQLGLALEPLGDELTPDNILSFLAELGLQFPSALLTVAFESALNTASTAIQALPVTLTQIATAIENDDESTIISAAVQLLQEVSTAITAFEQIGSTLGGMAATLPGMNTAEVGTFATNLAANILGYALISYLEAVQPTIVGILNLLGVVDYQFNEGTPGDTTHPSYTMRTLQLAKFGEALTNPQDALKDLYNWGLPSFDAAALLDRVKASMELFGLMPDSETPQIPGSTLVLSLLTISGDSTTNPPGLKGTLTYELPENFTYSTQLGNVWSLDLSLAAQLAAGLSISVTPQANVTFHPPTGMLNGNFLASLTAKGADAQHPIIVFGQTGGSRIQTDSFSLGAGVSITWNTSASTAVVEPQISAAIKGGKVVIDTSNADGFLGTVLSGVHVEAGFDVTATWAPDTGFHITGGAQLEIDLPLNLTLGPIKFQTLYLVAGASDTGLPLEISAGLGVTLGPIEASVDRVGVKGLLTFPPNGGNLGAANLAIDFKPPNGLGLAIDAGVVAGGGYILFNPDKGQYAGVLDVSLAEIIQVKVIAVLDTILPDGSHGFSFLLIITFDFPPIQLGFGFTLNGVGGLGGVNRTMNTDALHAGFRAHTLNNVLFPPDPIANAPQIISSIENFFPPTNGRYLFGPMLELGWGTPTLITLAVGVILEVPDPILIAILGLIDAGLPTADVALIELHIDVFGLIDFGAKTLSIDGSLYDSRVLIYSLAGDLALRLSWGDTPSFLFSLGGFNPHFNTAGLDVPQMNRLSVSIGNGDNPRISANSYFAVTSNTVQFGANVEAYASAGGFAIHGYLGFDVLIVISPFSFEFDFSAGFDVSYDGHSLLGLNVNGLFSGPTPWHLHGDASIDILFISVSASVDLTWGDSTPAVLPQKAVLPDLLPALADPRNWSAQLPDNTTQGVTLSAPKPDDTTLRVHPVGVLKVREKVVPLDLQISLYGNATPSDGNYFSISDVVVNTTDEARQPIQDYFAAGQFLMLSDADKVSAPSFEKYDAGVSIGSAGIVTGSDSPRTVVYEERYIDDYNAFSRFTRLYAMPASVHASLVRMGAAAASPLKNSGTFKFATGVTGSAVKANDAAYVITSVVDLSIRSDIAEAAGTTFFGARAALDSYLATHPEDAENLQIQALHEVAA